MKTLLSFGHNPGAAGGFLPSALLLLGSLGMLTLPAHAEGVTRYAQMEACLKHDVQASPFLRLIPHWLRVTLSEIKEKTMNRRELNRRELLKSLTAAAWAAAALPLLSKAADARPSDALYARCAKACAHCEAACRACHKHCLAMGANYVVSQRLSADCMELCAVAAKLSARKGPMAVAACRACLQACSACGAECGKYPQMSVMAACAKSCADCAAACRAMVTA